MAVVNWQVGFVYLANPHVASRATTSALLRLQGSVEVAHHHADLQCVIDQYPAAAACPTVLHTVRHPLDWLVSRYLCNGGERGEWSEWLRKRKPRIFNRFPEATLFAKYERLEADLRRITGCPVTITRDRFHVTVGKPKDYMSYWDTEDIAWAKKHFEIDFMTYNYD